MKNVLFSLLIFAVGTPALAHRSGGDGPTNETRIYRTSCAFPPGSKQEKQMNKLAAVALAKFIAPLVVQKTQVQLVPETAEITYHYDSDYFGTHSDTTVTVESVNGTKFDIATGNLESSNAWWARATTDFEKNISSCTAFWIKGSIDSVSNHDSRIELLGYQSIPIPQDYLNFPEIEIATY